MGKYSNISLTNHTLRHFTSLRLIYRHLINLFDYYFAVVIPVAHFLLASQKNLRNTKGFVSSSLLVLFLVGFWYYDFFSVFCCSVFSRSQDCAPRIQISNWQNPKPNSNATYFDLFVQFDQFACAHEVVGNPIGKAHACYTQDGTAMLSLALLSVRSWVRRVCRFFVYT